MTNIPRDNSLDSAPALLRDGYTFISKRCDRARSLLHREVVAPLEVNVSIT